MSDAYLLSCELESMPFPNGFNSHAAKVNEAAILLRAQAREIESLRQEIKNDAEQIRLTAEAKLIGYLQAGIEGKEGLYPDWIYEARNAIKHQNENIPWLPDLLRILGWQGGTVHQAMNAVSRMVESEKAGL